MLLRAISSASTLVSIQTPAFETQYSAEPASGTFAAPEAILTMEPGRPLAIMRWATARSVIITPVRFTASTFSQYSVGFVSTDGLS